MALPSQNEVRRRTPRHRCAMPRNAAFAAAATILLAAGSAHAEPSLEAVESYLFSQAWLQDYGAAEDFCRLGRGSFIWRKYGFGSNINNMLNAWVWALAVEGWEDMALINDPDEMPLVECSERSDGLASHGWNCLFTPMPHLCEFESHEAWMEYMESRGVPPEERTHAGNVTMSVVRYSPTVIDDALMGTSFDHFGAVAAVTQYLWSKLTPWIKEDIETIVRANSTAALSDEPFIGLHIRRGDKVSEGEAKYIRTEEYLAAAAERILHSPGGLHLLYSIKGIWVASDDPDAVHQVLEKYPHFFPEVDPDRIVWVSDGVEGGPDTRGIATHTNRQEYPGFAYMFADLQQLAAAEIFVGTFSSNIGRLVAVLREGLGRSRKSAVSLDLKDWYGGRV